MQSILFFCFLALVAGATAKDFPACTQQAEQQTGLSNEIAYGICVMKKKGYMDEQGVLQIDAIKKDFKNISEIGEKLAEKCARMKATPEESYKAFHKCIHEETNLIQRLSEY